jgi:hypothetical protein
MTKRMARWLTPAPIALSSLALAILLAMTSCGGSSSSGPQGPSSPGGVAACVSGTVASYLSASCSQGASVFHLQSYTCTSTPSSICTGLGTNGSNIQMALDPQGPYTLLVGKTSLWNVTAGQSVDVVISGTVYGALSNQNWPHFLHLQGQTGDGTEENKTTVDCLLTGGCTDSNDGVSDVLCSADSPPANCTDQSSIAPYSAYRATFKAAPSTSPYAMTVEIKLNGGSTGTATLYSVGLHLPPFSSVPGGSQ